MPVSLRDMRFLIHDVLSYEQHYQSLGLTDPPNRELVDAIIDEAARFTESELAPLNETGDVQGCRHPSLPYKPFRSRCRARSVPNTVTRELIKVL